MRKLERLDFEALRRAIRDLMQTFPQQYRHGEEYLRRADALEKRKPAILAALKKGNGGALDSMEELFAFQREALLANPLLDFDELLVVRRKPIGDARRSEAPSNGLVSFSGCRGKARGRSTPFRRYSGGITRSRSSPRCAVNRSSARCSGPRCGAW